MEYKPTQVKNDLNGHPILWTREGAISKSVFLQASLNMSERLQDLARDKTPLVILAQNRVAFMTGFCGALFAGCDVLLPNDVTAYSLKHLKDRYPGLVCLSDHGEGQFQSAIPNTIPITDIRAFCATPDKDEVLPELDAEHATITVFTSGSTGAPVGHSKSVTSFLAGAAHWTRRLGLGEGDEANIVATVPPQHMYGLEASVILPLVRSKTAVLDTRPFYPADIRQALAALPKGRVLVSTPLHLAALLKSGEDLPPLQAIVSATAPLSRETAQQAEDKWAAPVIEIYGSSEMGMIGSRRTAEQEAFSLRDDLSLAHVNGQAIITGENLEHAMLVPDILSPVENGFVFKGRGDDLINVAGKRASLSGLNAILNTISGVEDGVFYVPENCDSTSAQSERPIAFVVAPHVSVASIKAALRERIADVFIPRKFVFLTALPRNPSGKIPRQALDDALRHPEQGYEDILASPKFRAQKVQAC